MGPQIQGGLLSALVALDAAIDHHYGLASVVNLAQAVGMAPTDMRKELLEHLDVAVDRVRRLRDEVLRLLDN